MPGPEPNAADDPQGWLKWYQEEQAAKGAGGTAKPETKGDTTTTAKPGANPTALPGTGNTPPGQTGTLSAFPEGTKFPAGATTRGIAPNGLWYEKMGDGTVKEGYPASQADRLAVGAGPVNQQGSKTTAAQVQANATARTPQPTVATPPPAQRPVTGGILEKTSAILQNAGNAAGNAADQAGANASLRGAIGQSAAPGNQGPAIANAAGLPGTLSTAQGVTVPGMSQYNLSGYGVPSEGRQQLFDSSLNTLRAGQPNGPEIQRGPGQRGPGQTGNAINFADSGSGKGNSQLTSNIAPQTLFPTTTASVPGTYVKGEGNVNDSNRGYEVPFNIGPGGLSLANIGGSNVQVNSADKGTGFGFALNTGPSSNFGAATGRSLNNDPALQAMQVLQIMAAQNQGQSVTQMTDANRAQYSGNPAQGQGTYFSGSAPGPQATAVAPTGTTAAPAPASGVPNDDNGDGVPDYAKGGTVTSLLPRRTGKTARPLGMATGGSVIAPVQPGATAPEIAAGSSPQAASYTSSPATGTLPGSGTITSAGATAAGPNITVGPADATNPGTGSAYLSLTPEQQQQFQPFQTFAQQAASMQHARDNTDYIRGRAGLAKATEVPYFGTAGQTDQNLAPGQFQGYGSWINSLINNVGGKAQQLTELGNPEAPDVLNAKINILNQKIAPYQAASELWTKIQGYGDVGDEETLTSELNALKTAAGPIGTIAEMGQKLVELGNPVDIQPMLDNVGYMTRRQGELTKAVEDWQAANPGAAPPQDWLNELGNIANELGPARSALQLAMGKNNDIQTLKTSRANLLAQTGLTEEQLAPKLADYQTKISGKETQIKNAQTVKQLTLQFNNMGLGADPNAIASTLGGFQAQLTPLQAGLANSNKAAEVRGQLGNVLQTPLPKLPGFKKGGWIKTATANSHGQFAAKAKAAGKSTREFAAANQSAHGLLGKQARLAKTLMGFAKGGSMVTPERIIGIGATTGKPYFEVGEPHYPGGPDMAERLTKPASNKLKVTPLNRPSLPLGKGRKVAA